MKSEQDAVFIGCDWGSSNFRLALLTSSGVAVSGYQDAGGIVTLRRNGAALQDLAAHLRQGLQCLSDRGGSDLDAFPLIISGMAGSSIGILEVPYVSVPFALDGSNALVHGPISLDGIPNRVFIVGGVRTGDDVMRGEETEAIGLMSMIGGDDGLMILPGTHSKHLEISAGRICTFRTYMTGEIFSVIARQTILSQSITDPAEDPLDEEARRCFVEGLDLSGHNVLLHSLFTLRSRTLLEGLPIRGNAHRLSGLLIGEELRAVKESIRRSFILGGSGTLRTLYQIAIGHIVPEVVLRGLVGSGFSLPVWVGQSFLYPRIKQY